MNDRPSATAVEVPYTVRESPRARRVTLRMTVERGLEVVVPRGFDRERVPALVVGKTAWIARVEKRMAGERARLAAEPPDSLPDRIELAAVGEAWLVEYRKTESPSVTARARVLPAHAG
ncbi:MAG: SprT family zinc-dependent metalloprotease, partial [Thermoleophilia bacterium]